MVVLLSIWVAGSVLGVLSLALVAASSRPQRQAEEVPYFERNETGRATQVPALQVARVNA